MKISKFNESLENNTYYKLTIFFGEKEITLASRFDTSEEILIVLKNYIINGYPTTDNKYYPITNAYIEKISRIKKDEIKSIFDAKKYNL